ncbi:hypothetical protein EXU57_07520 [Segetibacter sp. 3557_3]|nr:hypothetical protein EXU57_07520 [Segetibacter sp. 3557_3]
MPDQQPSLTLIEAKLLEDFPSGSSIEYTSGKLYLFGDDATEYRVLDTAYNKLSAIQLFTSKTKRIEKSKKTDIESSTVLPNKSLLMLGSGSTALRNKLLISNATGDPAKRTIVHTKTFNARVRKRGIKETNYEGLTALKGGLVISNRGNLAQPVNHLVFTSNDFWKNQSRVSFHIAAVQLPRNTKAFAGISGLAIDHNDRLFFTASTEATTNAYDDGEIGDSYIGWINDISTKTSAGSITPNGWLKLSDHDSAFKDQKIEGVCIQEGNGATMLLHLVADNDKGNTRLFKVKLIIP